MIRPALLAAGLVVATLAGPDPALLDRAHDELLRSAFIPSPRNVHGEFRMLRRGDALCAQTLLYTPMLRRAVARIRAKEMRAWPSERAGHEDSLAYLAALEQATAHVLGGGGAAKARGKLQTMAIEFVVGEPGALFTIYELEIADTGTGRPATIRALRPIVVRQAAPDYVRAAIEHMQAAAFDAPPVDEGAEP